MPAESPDIGLSLLSILASLALVALNAFFVAAEFAVVKVRRTRVEELANQGIARAKATLVAIERLDESLSATQLGITLVSLALGWIGEEAFSGLLAALGPAVFGAGSSRHWVATAASFSLITLLHVVLGELVPKNLAIQRAENVAFFVSGPLNLFYRATRPVIVTFSSLANLILRLLGYAESGEAPLTESELKLVMEESHDEGVISDSEAKIIHKAFEFSDKRAADIVIPADRVDWLSLGRSVNENIDIIRRNHHTRFPLCRNDFDSVIGFVHMKDAWPQLMAHRSNDALVAASRPALFVPPQMRQDAILALFQRHRVHLAIVREPHPDGRALGILTLDDVLATLVGDVRGARAS